MLRTTLANDDPRWSAGTLAPLAARIGFLGALDRLLRLHQDELLDLAEVEIGKSRFETLTGDLMPLLASLRWHRAHAPRLLRPTRLGGRPWWQWGQRHEVRRVPAGRVAIIATWNYPYQLLGIQLVQAIVAGNRVCVKPSERAPRCQGRFLALCAEALEACGVPSGQLEVRPAERAEGERLLEEERFDLVLFTGSTRVGRSIAERAARTLTPTILELSGHDSAIVRADADLDLAARCLWRAVTMNAGQTCMAPRRILVEAPAYPAFLAHLARLAAAATPLRLVDRAAAERCHALALDAVARGARSLSGVAEPPRGAVLRPLVLADCPPDAPLFEGNHFGPLVAVAAVADLDEAIRLHRGVGQALATSIFSRSPSLDEASLAALGSSFVTWNDCILPTAHPAASLAGRGASGWGASRGAEGLLALTRSMTVSTTGRWRVPIETPTRGAQAWLARLARGLASRPGAARSTVRSASIKRSPQAMASFGDPQGGST